MWGRDRNASRLLIPVRSLISAAWVLAILPNASGNDEPGATRAILIRDPLPYGQPPVDYDTEASSDPIARLRDELANGTRSLEPENESAYLRSLLSALQIPESSQLLVFSKTAANTRQVSPTNPRAIYFNDEAYVGWVPGAPILELCGIDPVKGAVFYTLEVKNEAGPVFQRQRSCLTCHVSQSTLAVPGLMVRSMQTDERGLPKVGFSGVNHDSEYRKRWGGWYVTGSRLPLHHFGNVYGEELIEQHRDDETLHAERESLADEFDPALHLRATSDILPHLVFDHQWHAQNLMIRAHHEALFDRHSDVVEQLVRYFLFLDEPPLPAPVVGDAEFKRDFLAQAIRDDQGRSLRDFNLKHRLLQHRCSWLIHSRQFAGLPHDVQKRIAAGLTAVLSGEHSESESIPACERESTLAILRTTLPELFAEASP